MAKVKFNSLIDDKVAELTDKINTLKVANVTDNTVEGYISPNTRSTQLNARRREKDVLLLIKSLITPETSLDDKQTELLVRLTTLSSERVSTKYVFNEGDDVLELMTVKYQNLNLKSLIERASKVGLKIEGGKLVKA